MNTYDYAHYPGDGDYINYYIMLKPSVTYAGSGTDKGTDRATKLLVNGYNGDITGSEIKIYQFNASQREDWVLAMQNQNIESVLASGTPKTFATQSGVFNENSTFQDGNTQVNFTAADFQNNVGYVVKVPLKIRTKDVLSKLYFYWATQDNPNTSQNEELTELSIRSARPFDIADPVYKGGQLTLTNKPLADATLYFKKQNNKKDPLQGAEFSLYDTSENLLYTRISDSNGQVIIDSLKEGEYILKETKAPEGYKLSTNYYKITVSADKKVSYVGYDKDGKAIEGATGTGDGVIPDGSETGPITGTTSYTVNTPLITHIDNAPYAPYNLDDPIATKYSGEGIFDAHNAEHFNFRLEVNAKHPKQGDQIVIDFDDKWDLVKYAPVGFTFPNITDQNGNIVATPSVKYGSDLGDDNILTYTFNEKAEAYTDFIADIKFDGFIVPDIYKVQTNGTYTFTDNVQVKSTSGTTYVNQSVDKTIYVNYGTYNDGSFKHSDNYVINYEGTANPLSTGVPWITSGFQNIIKDGDKYYQRMMVIYNPNGVKNDGTYSNRDGTFYGDVPPATAIREVNVYRVTPINGTNRALLPVSTGINPKGDPSYTPVGSLTGIQSGVASSSGNISYNPGESFKYDERNTNPLSGPIKVTGLQPGYVGYGYAIELIYEITNQEVYARPSTITYNRPGTVFRFALKSYWTTSVNRKYNMGHFPGLRLGISDQASAGINKDTPPQNPMKLEIINEKAPMEIDLRKINQKGNNIRVGDLKLKLSQVDEKYKIIENGKSEEITLDLSKKTDGLYYDPLKLVFEDMATWPQGYYEIIESQAPPGYIKTDNRYIIELDWENYIITLIKVLDKEGTDANYLDNKPLPQGGVRLYPRGGTSSTGMSQPLFIVNNPASYPSTGGSGTRAFTVIGAVLMAFGLIKAMKKRRDPLLE